MCSFLPSVRRKFPLCTEYSNTSVLTYLLRGSKTPDWVRKISKLQRKCRRHKLHIQNGDWICTESSSYFALLFLIGLKSSFFIIGSKQGNSCSDWSKRTKETSVWLAVWFCSFQSPNHGKWVIKNSCQSESPTSIVRWRWHVIIKVYTKCDVFLLAYSTYRGVDRIFNMRILLSTLQKELIWS